MPCRPACWTPAGATSGGTRPACYLSSTGQPSRDTTVRFEIDAYPDDEPEDTFTNTRLLIDYALACKAEELVFLYRWDLKWCPVFGKLKTLLLNKWFTAIDLVCILQHSPVLEMLTLRFDNTKNIVGATGAQETIKQPLTCACLKFVYIECEKVDKGVREILNMLGRFGILRDQISIKEDPRPDSDYSSADSDSTDSD
ncbi:uncharacterized protein LOC119318385 isoform X1 [Triticum dicoccoides]|uniref:uncharacterized protein LOC119318385 isoform X1 n=1 Tax=Triticum dicoccoides TaxID=85692 RepID=UPI001891B907|nr:uncharacterized protein LOC119318385 isoform X1 [Triticum dicoccoides]